MKQCKAVRKVRIDYSYNGQMTNQEVESQEKADEIIRSWVHRRNGGELKSMCKVTTTKIIKVEYEVETKNYDYLFRL